MGISQALEKWIVRRGRFNIGQLRAVIDRRGLAFKDLDALARQTVADLVAENWIRAVGGETDMWEVVDLGTGS